jgi:hypothetical protein
MDSYPGHLLERSHERGGEFAHCGKVDGALKPRSNTRHATLDEVPLRGGGKGITALVTSQPNSATVAIEMAMEDKLNALDAEAAQ